MGMSESKKVDAIAKELGVSKDVAAKFVANPESLDRVKEMIAETGGMAVSGAEADNYIGCGGNAYKCGTKMEEMAAHVSPREAKIKSAIEALKGLEAGGG